MRASRSSRGDAGARDEIRPGRAQQYRARAYRTVEDIRASYGFTDLPSFLDVYYSGMSVLLKEEDFYDLTYAYLKRANSEKFFTRNCSFRPPGPHIAAAYPSIPSSAAFAGRGTAENILGIRTQLIMCFLRDLSAGFAMATLLE